MAKKYSDVFSWLGLPIDRNCVPMHSGAKPSMARASENSLSYSNSAAELNQ